MDAAHRKVLSIVLAISGIAWGGIVGLKSASFEDGGPPMGALAMSLPAILLIIGARACWPMRNAVKTKTKHAKVMSVALGAVGVGLALLIYSRESIFERDLSSTLALFAALVASAMMIAGIAVWPKRKNADALID